MKPFDPRLLRHARATRAYLVAMAVVGVALALLLVAQALLLAHVVTVVFQDGADLPAVAGTLWLLLAVVAARALVVGVRELLGRMTAGSVTSELRRQVLARSMALGPVGLARERRGELAATATTGLEALDTYFAGYLPQLVLAVVVPAVVMVRILPVDVTTVVIMALTLPLIPVFMALVGWASEAHTARRWRTLSRLSAHFLDVIEGLTTLRAYGRAEAQAETLDRVGDEYRRATMSTLRIAFLSSLVLELVATLSVAVVAVAVGLRVVDGGLALEPALAVLVLAPEVYLPLRQVGARFHDSMAGLEACDRVFAILEGSPGPTGADGDDQRPPHSPTGPADPVAGVETHLALRTEPLVLEAAGFTHVGRTGPALGPVDLVIPPGSTVSVVGPSGAGKTTLSLLLLRFAEPTTGALSLGRTPLAAIPLDTWREQLAWLPQRPSVLTDTVAANVRLGRPSASDAEVRAALAAVRLDGVVDGLPRGLDTVLAEDGADLSTGQRHRLALARVLLRAAPLVVVDEPTAHLDAESAAAVLEALDALRGTCTLVVVSHRPLLPSDVVLDLGRPTAPALPSADAAEEVR